MRILNKKAEKIILNKIVSEHNRIVVKPGKCRYNFRCHNNTVHEAVENGHAEIAMVIYFDDHCPIIHFINCHEGEYTDNTLGQWATRHEFYLIRLLGKDDFWYVHNLFNSYRAHLRNCLPFYVRWFSDVEF